MQTKKCGACEAVKPASEFHKRAASVDGLAARCKKCQQAYDVARRDDPKRKAQREANRPKYAHKQTEYNRKWRSNHPEKYKAHIILNNAVRDGLVTKGGCYVCQSTVDIEAHHNDYSKPLEVIWLCPKHHGHTRRIDEEEVST